MLHQVTGIPKVVIIGKDGLIKEIYGGMAPNMKELMVERTTELVSTRSAGAYIFWTRVLYRSWAASAMASN